jgi:hypothetical protein
MDRRNEPDPDPEEKKKKKKKERRPVDPSAGLRDAIAVSRSNMYQNRSPNQTNGYKSRASSDKSDAQK